jgi:hypothetical protein
MMTPSSLQEVVAAENAPQQMLVLKRSLYLGNSYWNSAQSGRRLRSSGGSNLLRSANSVLWKRRRPAGRKKTRIARLLRQRESVH